MDALSSNPVHRVGAQARPSAGSLGAALHFEGQRDSLCRVAIVHLPGACFPPLPLTLTLCLGEPF